MEMINVNGRVAINNLCSTCSAAFHAGSIADNTIDVIHLHNEHYMAICVHTGDCSILDMGQCPCGHIGFLEGVDTQFGICKERNDVLFDLDIDSESNERGTYCPSCQPSTCECCGKSTRLLKTIVTDEGEKKLCSGCSSNYCPCSVCEDIHTTNYYPAGNTYVCKSCVDKVVVCPHCGKVGETGSLYEIKGKTYCNHCSKEASCVLCSETTRCIRVEGAWVCVDHADDIKDLPHIDDYGRTRGNTFYKQPNENSITFLGIENEVQLAIRSKIDYNNLDIRKRIVAKCVKKFFKDCECKRDGSLNTSSEWGSTNNGVEMVWQPMTYTYINSNRDKFKQLFDKVSPLLAANMKESGMHIHINKTSFTPLALRKFMDFFYNPEMQELLYYISGRRANDYANLKKLERSGMTASTRSYAQALTIKQFNKKKHTSLFPDRYDVVNTTNAHTYEVRIFKGANTFEQFMYRVEFIAALWSFCNLSSINYTMDDFIKYVKSLGKYYPELLKHIKAFQPSASFSPDDPSCVLDSDDDEHETDSYYTVCPDDDDYDDDF